MDFRLTSWVSNISRRCAGSFPNGPLPTVRARRRARGRLKFIIFQLNTEERLSIHHITKLWRTNNDEKKKTKTPQRLAVASRRPYPLFKDSPIRVSLCLWREQQDDVSFFFYNTFSHRHSWSTMRVLSNRRFSEDSKCCAAHDACLYDARSRKSLDEFILPANRC